MDLAICLSMTPHRYLIGIANTHHLPDPRHTSKAELVDQLIRRLTNATTIQGVFAALSPDEQAALHRLAAHDGRIPLHDFTNVFGSIRPYRPWHRDGPTHPWRYPISTSEKLLYKGLIYLTPSDRQRRRPRYVILPNEFLDFLAPDDSPEDAQPALRGDQNPCQPPFDPLLDLALFLAYLQGADVRPLHGRWLSPRHFWALGSYLSPPYPCQGVRSELQADRIAFIHYLAESLGLVISVGEQLKPSPSALAWLSQPRPTQLQALWQAWLSPTDENRERWARYRLPGQHLRDPQGFARRLALLLATFPVGVWLTLAELVQSPNLALDELVPWWEREESNTAYDLLQEVLGGALNWLGLVRSRPGHPPQAQWCLTSLGGWLLGHPETSPPDGGAQSLTLAEDLVLTLPSRPQLTGLLALAEWTEMSPGPQLRLTPKSVTRAVERGGDVQDLFAALARYAAPSLTPGQRATLQSWAQEAAPVILRPSILLETVDTGQMDDLWGQRSIRSHLGCQLTPKLATVQTPDPQGFIQALRRLGLPVRSFLSSNGKGMDSLAPGDALWLTVAFLVHVHLARRLNLTSVPPAAVLERLTSFLGPAELAAAQHAAAEAIARLNEALEGPAPLTPTITQDALLDRLEAAIQGDQPLHIRYWSAWRGEITERCIQPQRIEWRGDRLYLIAHCHLRDAERTFRLDRILDVTVHPPAGCDDISR